MVKEIKYDYSSELDILHVYSSEINNGIKGGLSYGDFTFDISNNNKVVGIEIEEASKILKISPDSLERLDSVDLIITKVGNNLFVGVEAHKGRERSAVQFSVPSRKILERANVR